MYAWEKDWIKRHINEINDYYDIDLRCETEEDLQRNTIILDIYENEDAFNEAFIGWHLRKEEAFKLLSSEGCAMKIGKVCIYFNEMNYESMRKEMIAENFN